MASPFTLLLVEDDPGEVALFEELLSEVAPDIHVRHVENGHEALRYLRRERGYEDAVLPHLVVLDLNMPVMNGHDFLKRVKNDERSRGIPVLVLSTSDHPSDVRRSYDGHASGYVVKPGTLEEYMRVMETVEAYWRGVVKLPTLGDLAH